MDRLTATEFEQADGVEEWRVLADGASAWFDAPSQTAGAALVEQITEVVGAVGGLPDVDLRAGGVRVRVGATAGPLTEADVSLAGAVSGMARDLGLSADPSALQSVRVAIESPHTGAVMAFWQTVLSYASGGADVLWDPLRRDPAFSFHRHDEPRMLRDRIHVDVSRIPEAVAAVKTAVGQKPFGAYGFTLADADGNEVDLVPGDQLSEDPETADWQGLFGAMMFYPTSSPGQAARLATVVARLADDARLPLMVDLRPDGVMIDSGKDQAEDDERADGLRFADLASQVQPAARDLRLTADPSRLRFVQLGIDAVDVTAVRTFWTTVLGYQHDPRTDVADIYDQRRLNPVIIFQQMDAADRDRRQQRGRIHLDLVVPHDQTRARIEAAVSAGGVVVTDETPGHCLVADPEGNEVDIVTRPID